MIIVYSENETEGYMVQRTELDAPDKVYNHLPSNYSELRKTYQDLIAGQLKAMEGNIFKLWETTEMTIDDFLAVKIHYQNPGNGRQNGETIILILDRYFYTITYINGTDFSEDNKNAFFKSMRIDTKNSPRQVLGSTKPRKAAYLMGQLSFVGLFHIWDISISILWDT